MSSILTNNDAMVALQTLKSINPNLGSDQNEIATRKSVGSAKDNSAVWAVSKTMEADVSGFTAISDSLALGQETVAVARKASDNVTKLLAQMQERIIAATGENVDRTKLQADVVALRDQIASTVGAAQLNGRNHVNGGGNMEVLSSLNRSSTGVTTSSITVTAQNLSVGTYKAKAAFTAGTGITGAEDAQAFNLDAGANDTITTDAGAAFAAGDRISVRVRDKEASYTFKAADVAVGSSPEDIAAVGLKSAIEALGVTGLTVDYDSATPGQLTLNNGGTRDLAVAAQFQNAGSGGLGALAGIDVTAADGATAALASIETLRNTTVNAAAAFGSVEGRISAQSNFVSGLTDSLKLGIGTLVDANMEEASARLQALQAQQQLGVQALSIADQAPQSFLSLFR